MRPIKFRAWDKERNQMFQVHTLGLKKSDGSTSATFTHEGLYSIDEETGEQNRTTYLNNFELMQYTGLKDKNGKEIYEGDIVKDLLDEPAIVEFGTYMAGGQDYYAQGAYGFYVQRLFKGNKISDDDTQTLNDSTEVIGNIYENHELLK